MRVNIGVNIDANTGTNVSTVEFVKDNTCVNVDYTYIYTTLQCTLVYI